MHSQRRGTAQYALPWRQLGIAFAISLVAHFIVFVSAIEPFSFKNHGASAPGGLRMRSIEMPVVKAFEAAPQTKPAPQIAAAPIPTLPPDSPQTSVSPPEPMPEKQTGNPILAQGSNQNDPLPHMEPTQHATKTVVIALSSDAEPSPSSAQPATQEASPPPLQLQFPSNAKLQFSATVAQRGQAREGRGQMIWQSDGQAYSLKIEASMLLISILELSSVGKISEIGLAPERFAERRGLRSEQAAHFRPQLGKIQFSNNKPEAHLEGGAQDRLSVLLLLSSLFAGNADRIDPGNVIRVQVASTDLAETWDIRYDGQEEIQLPVGTMKTMKLSRQARREFDRNLQIWLAPSLGFLPVRILQTAQNASNEDFFDLKLLALP